jgi:hypothetical protein
VRFLSRVKPVVGTSRCCVVGSFFFRKALGVKRAGWSLLIGGKSMRSSQITAASFHRPQVDGEAGGGA